MVSALVSGSSGSGSSPDRGHCVCTLARHFTLTVYLSTQVYKWVLANLMLGVTLQWTSIPFRGSRNSPRLYPPTPVFPLVKNYSWNWKEDLHENYDVTSLLTRPFYSYVLSYLVYECKRGWR